MGEINIKQRLTYIDIARAIGILFVVLGHVNQFYRDSQGIENSQTLIFIYAFHMPLFFILSGILFSEKTFHELSFFDFLIKKVKALLVPYLFLDITAGLYETVISSKIQISSIAEVVKNTLTLHCNVGANWFISALFIGEIFLYFFLKYYRSIYKYIVWIPFLIIPLYYPFSTHWINVFVRGVIAFTFMLVGYYLKDYYKSDVNKRWDVIILSGTLTYVIAMLNGQIDFWCSKVGTPILCMIGGLIGAYWVIGLSKNIKSKILVFIGQNTMTMMGTHMIMFRIVWNLCSIKFFNIIPLLTANVYGEILIFILIIAANLPIMYVYDRYLPFLIGKRK